MAAMLVVSTEQRLERRVEESNGSQYVVTVMSAGLVIRVSM